MHSSSSPSGPVRRNLSRSWMWTIIVVAGLVIWLACMNYSDAQRAWRALFINFIYFTPLTVGMVVWPAVVNASNGRWAEPIEHLAMAGIAFAPVSILAFIGLWFGRVYWAGWMREAVLPQGIWLSNAFIFSRDGAAIALMWGLAAWFVSKKSRGEPVGSLTGVLPFVYAMVFSLLGFDLVMGLDPKWYSSLFGGYFLVSGMYIAVAGWTLTTLIARPQTDKDRLHDLGKLVVTLSLLTTYMMFCQLLPIWYENLPHEVRFVIPRLRLSPWKLASLALLSIVYLGPLVFLLLRRAKRSAVYLGAIAFLVLAGMWLERWWLVTPTLGGRLVLGLPEVSLTASFAAAMIIGIIQFNRRISFERAREKESP
jgi:hypothetical protein